MSLTLRRHQSRSYSRASPFRPYLEALEDRTLPATLTVTSTADSGPGTLRAEIAAAASGDTIMFSLPSPSTIHLTSATLSINSSIHISGPGASVLTINGNHSFPVFTIQGGSPTITGLTVSGGSGNGGGIIGSVTLAQCLITGNQSTGGGGGIFTSGATITDCTISNNSATTDGGGIEGSNFTLTRCIVTNNSARSGGGIEIDGGGAVTISGSTISSNMATHNEGGGIDVSDGNLYLTNSSVVGNMVNTDVEGPSAIGGGICGISGFITITNSLIASNSATAMGQSSALGGGITCIAPTTIIASTISNNNATGGHGGTAGSSAAGGGLMFGVSFTLSNCTISGNRATSGASASGNAGTALGGGIDWNLSSDSAAIINCTVTQNVAAIQALSASGVANGGGIAAQGGALNLQNTIVAANSTSTADPDFLNQATSTTALYNLISDGTGSNLTAGSNGNQVGTSQFPINPKLGGLNNYGGPTPTIPLLAGSPAIDKGTNANVQTSTDQRGLPRIVSSSIPNLTPTVDIGAFEVQPLHLLAVGADLGGLPEVKVYDAGTGVLRFDFNAYETSFKGGVRVAVADMNADGIPDIITAPGGVKVTLVSVNGTLTPAFDLSAGRAPEIKVFSGADGNKIADFLAYPSSFTAGVFVAVADLNHDGIPDIFTAPEATGQSGHTNVRIFFSSHLLNTGGALNPDREFNAYDPGFGGGVRISAADMNGDGFADIVTAPGIWSGPDIRIFDGKTLSNASTASKIGEFLAYDFRYFGGVFVSTGDVNGDTLTDIVTGTNGNGGPEARAFSGANVLGNPSPRVVDDFFAYDPAFNGGARVALLDVNGDGKADIITGAGPGGTSHVRVFDGGTELQLQNSALDSFIAFDVLFSGGVFVGAG